MKQYNVQYKKRTKNSHLKKKIRFFFVSLRFFRFILLISVCFRFRFFLGQAIFRFIFISLRFFRFFSLISRSFSLQIFAVSLRCETSEVMLFFASKRKEIFASISIFASEAKTRAHPSRLDKNSGTLYSIIPFYWAHHFSGGVLKVTFLFCDT
jgi:hypothetical protein